MEFNRDKFKQLVQYICSRCDDPTELGSTKLNKILWYADYHAYYFFNEAITGAKYVKRQFGPVPPAILQVLKELQEEGFLAIRNTEHFGHEKKEFFALRPADLSLFTAREISVVDKAIEYVCKRHTAKSISEETHDDIWEMAQIGEEIPYYTVFASQLGEITEHEIEWAKALIEELETS